jgi:hypothetical protein
LPAIPANGTYTMEIIKQAGSYSAAGKQTLAALAQGHRLKLHLSDVRNQDGTIRGSGNLTFDVNAAAVNTGRDAPRQCGAGPVRDCWIVAGPPVDDATHQADPLLYVTCFLDLTTNPADQVSLGPVRHVCRVDNSWMNVKAGSIGNPGNPGPAGFANDPQAVSYRPQLLDGTSNLLDWSWLDASVNSASNPITTGGTPGDCANISLTSNGNWLIPTSVGQNAWQHAMAFYYHTDGTPPAGMTNNKMYFVYAVGIENQRGDPLNKRIIHLSNAPFNCAGGSLISPTTQGSGNQTFSYRVWHTHWQSWYTMDQTAAENWTNGASRTTSPFYPALTASEQLYWKETGVVIPLRLTMTPSDPINPGGDLTDHVYEPLSNGNIHGGSTGGDHDSLGQVNEYWAQAFLLETKNAWDHARIADAVGANYQFGTMMNEATGRIPAVNHGPPGTDHAGSGASYAQLGSPFGASFPQGVTTRDGGNIYGVAKPLYDVPVADGNGGYAGGRWGGGPSFGNDHLPAFHNGTYQIFGSRYMLEGQWFTANRTITILFSGPGRARQDDIIDGVHYYGLSNWCCEGRGDFHAYREKSAAAAVGGDSNEERKYFSDVIHEQYYYELAFEARIDGDTHNFRSNFSSPWAIEADTFMESYGFQTMYQAYAMMRDPLADLFIQRFLQLYISNCSDTDPNGLPSFLCATYQYVPNLRDGGAAGVHDLAPNTGQYYASDSTERGIVPFGFVFDGSSTVSLPQGETWFIQNGDKLKPVGHPSYPGPDELRTDTWYTVANITTWPDGGLATMQIINPATGTPFTSFKKNGAPFVTNYSWLKVRSPNYGKNVSFGWYSPGYAPYAQAVLYGLHDLGFTAIDPAIAKMTARGFVDPGPQATKRNWDPNVNVP